MDKIIIKDLLARGIIGIHDDERKRTQDILINIKLSVDTREAAESDHISDCVNYSELTKKILLHAETRQRYTLEALANDIADLCLSDNRVHDVCVRVEKPGAVRFTKSVGIEVYRSS